ncbi:MAG: helix-turn-helix transcriptional regulator [bacterium]|nr:helix-turn-helix transcriptional regulator [bacterium]
MTDETELHYRNMGLRLKAIRQRLKMTLAAMQQETGLSRGYLSNFERGFKMPTVKYLKYLHDEKGVSLNYIFGTDERMFRPDAEEAAEKMDFGRYTEDVDELLYYISHIPHSLFDTLGEFTKYKIENPGIVNDYFSKLTPEEKNKLKFPVPKSG